MRTKFLSVYLFLFLLSGLCMSQQIYWATPPYKFWMTPSTPSYSTLPPSGSQPYSVSNGAFDENGNVMFYVKDRGIFNSTGTQVGTLPTANNDDCGNEYAILNTEISIVPIPGTCRQFYVIYALSNTNGNASALFYIKVNCSSGSPVPVYNTPVWVHCPPASAGWQNEPFVAGGVGGAYNLTFAVSKVYTGSGSTAKRYIFSVAADQIVRSEISSTGISAGTVVVTGATLGFTGADFYGYEAELSWGSNYFAWSATSGKVHIIGLNSSGQYVASSIRNYSYSAVRGIEFDNSTTSPKLFVSYGAGISLINVSANTTSSVSTGVYNLSNTFLEYGKNNRIYGISPVYSGSTLTGTYLVGINAGGAAPGINATIDSRYILGSVLFNGFFTLPDQVDGDDYTYWNALAATTVNGITLNGSPVYGNCDMGGISSFCQNANYLFNATYTNGTPTHYRFDIESVDAGCQPITGAGKMAYHGPTWTAGVPAANFNLKTLTDGNGLNIGNVTGLVRVLFTVKDACGFQSLRTMFFNVVAPVPPTINLEIYNRNSPQNYLAASHNPASPIACGSATIGFRLSNSTGTVNTYTVVIDEVSSTGVFIKNIYNKTTSISGVSGLTYEAFNSECVPSTVWPVNPGAGACGAGASAGYTGYFAYNNGQYSFGKYFKLTVTIGNSTCGYSSDYSYLYVNSINNRLESSVENTNYNVYPNPASDNLNIDMTISESGKYTITLFDMTGRKSAVLLENTFVNEGEFKRSFDISSLPTGVYSYEIRSENNVKSGIISKQ